ncbi:hypothetical protein [Arthrobacter sp. HLT1-20]
MSEMHALRITEANHIDDAFWHLGIREHPRMLRILFEFNSIKSVTPAVDSECDYILDRLEGDEWVDEKFISKETAAELLVLTIDEARAEAKAENAAMIARLTKGAV